MAERRASAVWEGNLPQGHGHTSVASGAFRDLPITWKSRTEGSQDVTSPEELIAAAQASCFAMAFSNALAQAGHAPEQLTVNTVCTFDRKPEGGWKIGSMDIDVVARVSGVDAAEFDRLAEDTSRNCPVSGALKGNVEIRVKARMES